MTDRFRYAAVFFCVSALLVGCSGRLSTSEAEKLLTREDTATYRARLQVGHYSIGDMERAFEKAGILRIEGENLTALTDKGQQIVGRMQPEPCAAEDDERWRCWLVPLGDRHDIEVTATEGNEALGSAFFDWTFVPNEVGVALGLTRREGLRGRANFNRNRESDWKIYEVNDGSGSRRLYAEVR